MLIWTFMDNDYTHVTQKDKHKTLGIMLQVLSNLTPFLSSSVLSPTWKLQVLTTFSLIYSVRCLELYGLSWDFHCYILIWLLLDFFGSKIAFHPCLFSYLWTSSNILSYVCYSVWLGSREYFLMAFCVFTGYCGLGEHARTKWAPVLTDYWERWVVLFPLK